MLSYSVVRCVWLLKGTWVGSFSVDQHVRLLNGTLDGFLLCRLDRQALKGAHWVRYYSVDVCVVLLKGLPE